MSRTAYSPNVERQQFRARADWIGATPLSMPSLHNFPNSAEFNPSLFLAYQSPPFQSEGWCKYELRLFTLL